MEALTAGEFRLFGTAKRRIPNNVIVQRFAFAWGVRSPRVLDVVGFEPSDVAVQEIDDSAFVVA